MKGTRDDPQNCSGCMAFPAGGHLYETMHSRTAYSFRPPAPVPHARPLGLWALLKALRSNPLECWTTAHFEEPVVLGGFPFARYAVVSDPAAIRQVVIEENSAYRKSNIERRVLASRMPNGLVTVDGEQWQRQRRMLAPLFGRRMTAGFGSAMGRVADALVARWQSRPNDSVVEIKAEMSRVALEAWSVASFPKVSAIPKRL
jgi:cytochrome P450